MLLLYSGGQWAKWISVVLFTLGGAMALPVLFRDAIWYMILMGGGMAALYLSFAWLLVWSRSIHAFLEYQRREIIIEQQYMERRSQPEDKKETE
jgi:hypothetical protein